MISGFGGSLVSSLFIQSGISVGASGALFGLLGGMLSELFINWTIYANKVNEPIMCYNCFLMNDLFCVCVTIILFLFVLLFAMFCSWLHC